MAAPSMLRDRTLAALLAHHAGDSLGATLEFKSHAAIKEIYPDGLRDIVGGGYFGWQPGQATDDSDMTRGLLLAYRDLLTTSSEQREEEEEGHRADIAHLAGKYFLLWLNTPWPMRRPGSMPVDMGNATYTGLMNLARTGDPATSGAGQGSAGNGSLMRCLPTALFRLNAASGAETIVAESVSVSAITHDDTTCTLSCVAYCIMANQLIYGTPPREAVEAGLAAAATAAASSTREEADAVPVVTAIKAGQSLSVAKMARDGPDLALVDLGGGYVLDSLILAVAAVLDERPLEDVLVDVLRVGRDTDTNGAIAGGLLGARDGLAAIPERWLSTLQYKEEYEQVVDEILAQSRAGDIPG